MDSKKPSTCQDNLAKLPRALAPLIERPQWAVWRWTQKPDGTWQKPPFMALQPDQHASTSDPSTWTDYEAALDAVETRRADGITYVLTEVRSSSCDRSRPLSRHSHVQHRSLGAELSRRRSPLLQRNNAVRRGLSHLGAGKRR